MLKFAIGINLHVGKPVRYIYPKNEQGQWLVGKEPVTAFTMQEVTRFLLAFTFHNSKTVFFDTETNQVILFFRDEKAHYMVQLEGMSSPASPQGFMEIEIYDEAGRLMFTECVRF